MRSALEDYLTGMLAAIKDEYNTLRKAVEVENAKIKKLEQSQEMIVLALNLYKKEKQDDRINQNQKLDGDHGSGNTGVRSNGVQGS